MILGGCDENLRSGTGVLVRRALRKNNVRERGEFQLTSSLDRLRREDGFLDLIIEGRRYDIGLPEYYLETLRAFSTA